MVAIRARGKSRRGKDSQCGLPAICRRKTRELCRYGYLPLCARLVEGARILLLDLQVLICRLTGRVVYRVRALKRELESGESRIQTDQLIESVKGMRSRFRRGGGAGIVVFPRPNPQTVPCGRGTSRRGERTCWPSDCWLLFRGKSQSASECRDSSKV